MHGTQYYNLVISLVIDPPPSILAPTNVSVLPGNDVVMTCVAYSTVDFNMTWLGVNGKPLPSRGVIHNNGSLVIRYVELQCKKATIHQLTTIVATSKSVLFLGHNHLLTTGADDPTFELLPERQRE